MVYRRYTPCVDIAFHRAANKALVRAPKAVGAVMISRLTSIAADPFATHPNVTALKGQNDAFPLRVGDWRAVYRVSRADKTLFVESIAHRREAYRGSP